MDTMIETYFHGEPDDLHSPESLLDALVQAYRDPSSFAREAPQEPQVALDDLADLLRWRVALEAPSSFEEQSTWLARLEGLDLAARGLSRLLPAHPWLRPAGELLEAALADREPAVRQLAAPWWHSRTAELQLDDLALPDLRPWSWLPDLAAPGALDARTPEERENLLRAWGDAALSSALDAALRHAVLHEPGWTDLYRGWLARRGTAWIELRNLSLELQPAPVLFRLPLPHLGRGKELRGILTPEGTRWVWPGHERTAPRGASSVSLPLGEPLGDLSVTLHEQALDLQQHAERVLQSSRHLLDGIPDDQHLRLALRITRWCEDNLARLGLDEQAGSTVWRWLDSIPHLGLAAHASRHLPDDDGAPDAFWPALLAEIRFHLENSLHVLQQPDVLGAGAAPLADALRALDLAGSGSRDALSLLEDGFLEELADTLGPLPESAWCSPAPPVPHGLLRELRPFLAARPAPGARAAPATRAAPSAPKKLRAPRPLVAVALGADGGPVQGERIDWASGDGWGAFLSLPRHATEDTVHEIFFHGLPPGVRTCQLAGLTLEILSSEGAAPCARVRAGDLFRAEQEAPEGLSVLRIEVNGGLSEAHEVEDLGGQDAEGPDGTSPCLRGRPGCGGLVSRR